jgi:L-threonylcarbamoyladenylate synthase
MTEPESEIVRAAGIIRKGGLVAFPTETVYGLGANALDVSAVDRIFVAKGRPATSPLIVHVGSIRMAQELAVSWPEEAQRLAEHFWPGPLTLVLPKQDSIPDRVTAGLPSVGLRWPKHSLAQALLDEAALPIAAPSANRFTQVSPTTASHVQAALGSAVDMILDGGPSAVGIESTVLSLARSGRPLLLRPGMISRSAIEAIIGPVEAGTAASGAAHPAPGMHHKHYSPRTPLVLTDQPSERSAYLWWSKEQVSGRSVHMSDAPAAYAQSLYAVLLELDGQAWDSIAVEPLPTSSEWEGIRDRLRRAAAR